MATHSLMQAAGLLGVNKSTLQTWLSQGCPAVERGDRDRGQNWQIDLKDVMEWRVERAVADAVAAYGGDGDEMSKDEADRRRAVALAHMAEIDLDERRHRIVDRGEAISVFADFCLALRNGMSQGLDKMAARAATITVPHEIRAMGQNEWNRAMKLAREDFHRLWGERFGHDAGSPPPNTE